MPPHDYTPQQALEILLQRLSRTVPEIAIEVRNAISQGKEVEVVAVLQTKSRTKKARQHREKVPFSEEEALEVAIKVLEAYFVEIPHFINSSINNFDAIDSTNGVMGIQIEQVPETDLNIEREQKTMTLKFVSESEIEQQQANLAQLAELFRFKEDAS